MKPLDRPGCPFLKWVPTIFQNLPQVLELSQELLEILKERIDPNYWDDKQSIADIFLKMVDSEYCY